MTHRVFKPGPPQTDKVDGVAPARVTKVGRGSAKFERWSVRLYWWFVLVLGLGSHSFRSLIDVFKPSEMETLG